VLVSKKVYLGIANQTSCKLRLIHILLSSEERDAPRTSWELEPWLISDVEKGPFQASKLNRKTIFHKLCLCNFSIAIQFTGAWGSYISCQTHMYSDYVNFCSRSNEKPWNSPLIGFKNASSLLWNTGHQPLRRNHGLLLRDSPCRRS
jgi:hypothetical protein